jgi:hypothetical protein
LARIGELPRIDKYSVAANVSVDPLETAVNLVRSFPDIVENLPTIAVTSTSGKNLKLGLGDKFTSVVVPHAIVTGAVGPYNLVDGDTLIVTTQPNGLETYVITSKYVFRTYMFSSMSSATAAEVARAINAQALYAEAMVSNNGAIQLAAGGLRGREFPNKITIVGGSAVSKLGFTIGQSDKNYGPGKKAYTRHHLAAELTAQIEVFAESDNVRTELSDLLYDFLSYVMADRKFQFYGRSIYDSNIQDETYQIILRDDQVSISGDQEMARPNDPKDKIYIARFSIPVIAIQYSDRVVVNQDGSVYTPQIAPDLIADDTLPEPN